MGVEVRQFTWNYLDSNMYVLMVEGQALVIDPIDCEEAFDYIRLFHEIIVLLTHEHFDHICGLNKLRAEHQCTVIAQEKCSERIQSSKANLSAMAEIMLELSGKKRDKRIAPFICERADVTFDDKYVLNWAGVAIDAFSTPGHSPGSACFSIDGYLFTGDSLLKQGPMNRFSGGSRIDYLQKTIPIIKQEMMRVKSVFPGHGKEFLPNAVAWI